jgi:cation diffusion facilitator family transporter
VPHAVPEPYTLAVLFGVVALKEGMFRYAQRVARQTGSGAVHVDAWHHRSDAITSLAAAVGITVALVGGKEWAHADEVAALVAAAIIIFNAWVLSRQPVGELMDTFPAEIAGQSRAVAAGVAGVAAVEKIRARKVGLNYLIDMHIEVNENMTVRDAHDLAHHVKDEVCAAIPGVQDVLVHVEPHPTRAPRPFTPPPATPAAAPPPR